MVFGQETDAAVSAIVIVNRVPEVKIRIQVRPAQINRNVKLAHTGKVKQNKLSRSAFRERFVKKNCNIFAPN